MRTADGVERLHGLDTLFLYLETPTAPLHVGMVAVFDGSTAATPFSFEAFVELVRSRLHRLPPFRRRLLSPYAGLVPPVWVEDQPVDLHAHIHRLLVPGPLTEQAIVDASTSAMAQPLDRGRPLWEMRVVEATADDRVAIIAKIHHAAVDGVAGVSLLGELLDIVPEPPAATSAPWHPSPASVQAVRQSSLRWSMTQPARWATTLRDGMSRVLASRRLDRPAPEGPPRRILGGGAVGAGPLTGRRHLAFVSLSMETIRAVSKHTGCTVNDVVLTVCGGALRRSEEFGGGPGSLVAGVPVSRRSSEDPAASGNRVSAMLISLASDVEDPLARLRAVSASANAAKQRESALEAGEIVDGLAELLTSVAGHALGRLADRATAGELLSPPCDVLISNLPGPPIPLYANGMRLLEVTPFGPIAASVPLNITVISYLDTLHCGLLACPDAVPHLDAIAADLSRSLDELASATSRAFARN